jgi:hypothetical protein
MTYAVKISPEYFNLYKWINIFVSYLILLSHLLPGKYLVVIVMLQGDQPSSSSVQESYGLCRHLLQTCSTTAHFVKKKNHLLNRTLIS